MTSKKRLRTGHAVGLEFDHLAIRAARLVLNEGSAHAVESLVDVAGDFSTDDGLVDGLRQVRDRLKLTPREPLGTCLSGKQVYVSQIPFRRLAREEMESALRLEARKHVPFDVAGAALDYQVLDGAPEGSQSIEVLVALAGAGILAQHLKVLERAGLNPSVVDVLPVAAGNALWNWVDPPRHDAHHVALHIGPQISTIVIDGARSPYFNRYVYFAAEDFVNREQGDAESDKRIQGLADEVSRSLAFYESSAGARGFQEISLLGEYLDIPSLEERLRRQTGLAVRKMDMPRRLGYQHDFPAGRFDLAVALALLAGGEE